VKFKSVFSYLLFLFSTICVYSVWGKVIKFGVMARRGEKGSLMIQRVFLLQRDSWNMVFSPESFVLFCGCCKGYFRWKV